MLQADILVAAVIVDCLVETGEPAQLHADAAPGALTALHLCTALALHTPCKGASVRVSCRPRLHASAATGSWFLPITAVFTCATMTLVRLELCSPKAVHAVLCCLEHPTVLPLLCPAFSHVSLHAAVALAVVLSARVSLFRWGRSGTRRLTRPFSRGAAWLPPMLASPARQLARLWQGSLESLTGEQATVCSSLQTLGGTSMLFEPHGVPDAEPVSHA